MAKDATGIGAYTGNSSIDTLLSPYKWQSATLSYGFPTAGSTWNGYEPGTQPFQGFAALTDAQKTAVRSALQEWASVADLNITPVQGAAIDADLRFSVSSTPATAEAYMPSPGDPKSGDAWFGTSLAGRDWTPGSYAYSTVVHEVGHTLGLKHPHDEMGGGARPASEDSVELSIMSYRSYPGASIDSGLSLREGHYATGPMLDDIAAIQALYGANYGTSAEDTIYTYTPDMPTIFDTVWDGGGIDGYDLSGYTTAVAVDLRPGQWSTFSASQLAVLDPTTDTRAQGNIANAHLHENDARAHIENATGGSGNDTITGNDVSNSLIGNAGNDVLTGAAGNDVLAGEDGDDTLYGGQDADALGGGGGSDLLDGGEGDDLLSGGADNDTLLGGAGNNYLIGGEGTDALYGDAGDDVFYGSEGDDLFFGDLGADQFILIGLSGTDTVQDFNVADGDRMVLAAGTTYSLTDSGAGAVVDLGGDRMVLAGLPSSQLPPDSFLFI